MIAKPLLVFKPHFFVEIIEPEQVILFSEDKHYLLKGKIYATLAKLLKKNPTSKSLIIEILSAEYPDDLIQTAIQRLISNKFIAEYVEDIPNNIAGFWTDIDLPISYSSSELVKIKNFSQQCPSSLINALESLSIKTSEVGDFTVVVTDNYISNEIELFNLQRLQDKKPWMLLKPTGRVVWIGPIFLPGKTGCWNCLAHRIKENKRVEVDLFGPRHESMDKSSPIFLPTSFNVAMNLAAIEVAKWLRSKSCHPLHQNLITFDLGNIETKKHAFRILATCPICQNFPVSQKTQLTLKHSKKRFFYDTGERNCSLDETYDNLKSIVSPITGIISSINHAVVNEEHICYTVRTLPLPQNYDKNDRYLRMPDAATGKGKSKLQATVGCIAEAIERYNCSFTTHTEIRCNFDEIKQQAIHPHALLNFSESQYINREHLNRKKCGFNHIPKQYDGSNIGWTATYSIIDDRITYVPSSYCYLYYPFEKDSDMCPGNSNGCASGNSLEEAIFYGILELAERDGVGIWWYNRIKRPCVDLETLNNVSLNQLSKKFKEVDRELYVLDITTDLEIPCYAAVSWKLDGSRICLGTGAHLNPDIAIARAISELNQTMIRANTPKDINLHSIPEVEYDLVKWLITEKIESHPYLNPSGISTKSYLYEERGDFLVDVQRLLEILKKNKMQILILDLSHPNIDFHTARVIIPGLRHSWSRLAPGRLYETPVKLGWIQNPLDESEMNPISYFL